MSSRPLPILLLALSIGVTMSGMAAGTAPAQQPADTVLATVNDEQVTVGQVLAVFSDRHSGHAKFLGGDAELRKFLKIVIDDRLLVQEAYDLGLDESDEVKQRVDSFAVDKMTNALVRMEIDEKAKPSPEAVKSVWSDRLGVVIQAHQVVLPTLADARAVRAGLLSGSNWETVSRQCSIAESAKRGGVVMVSWGTLDPVAEEAVFALEEGQVSEVIPTAAGFEVYLADARVDVPQPEFAKVAKDIETVLLRRNLEARRKALSSELWSRYSVARTPDPEPATLPQLFASAPDTVLATWNGGRLTLRETISADEAKALASGLPDRARREFDNRIHVTINGALVALEAKARKLDELPEIAQQLDEYRDYVMEGVLFRDHIFNKLEITDDEIGAYYKEHSSLFEVPEQLHVAQILVPSEAEAKGVTAKLAAGAKFEELAGTVSRDIVSAGKGGDLGWITRDKIPPAFSALATAQPGAVLPPGRTEAGWHVVKLLEIRPKALPPLAEQRDKVREAALDAKKRELRTYWVDKLRKASRIEIDDKAIAAFVRSNEFDAGDAPPQHVIR
jgi:peptidyl-prolyl cis-trans isomerase C